MWESKAQDIAMSTDVKLSSPHSLEEGERYKMTNVPYRSVIGLLMYLMVSTRSDLAAPLSILSRFLANSGLIHLEAMKKALCYLRGTISMGLKYQVWMSHFSITFIWPCITSQRLHQIISNLMSYYVWPRETRCKWVCLIWSFGGGAASICKRLCWDGEKGPNPSR